MEEVLQFGERNWFPNMNLEHTRILNLVWGQNISNIWGLKIHLSHTFLWEQLENEFLQKSKSKEMKIEDTGDKGDSTGRECPGMCWEVRAIAVQQALAIDCVGAWKVPGRMPPSWWSWHTVWCVWMCWEEIYTQAKFGDELVACWSLTPGKIIAQKSKKEKKSYYTALLWISALLYNANTKY